MKTLEQLRIAVLCGGPGAEREVSLASGESVCGALGRAGLRPAKVVVPGRDPESCLERLDCDVAVMMLHGEFGEDGRAQAILERRGIAFTGSSSAVCGLAMDKERCKRVFVAEGVPTPPWATVADVPSARAEMERAGLAFPLVVKPVSRGSSVGVAIVREEAELDAAVAGALGVDARAMLEEFVAGREVTVGWLDGDILPAIELIPDGVFYDYRAKYQSDRTRYLCPAPVAPDVSRGIAALAAAVSKILSVRDLARVDIIVGASGPRVLEINTLPGFTSHSLLPLAAATAGLAMPRLCRKLAEMAVARAGLL